MPSKSGVEVRGIFQVQKRQLPFKRLCLQDVVGINKSAMMMVLVWLATLPIGLPSHVRAQSRTVLVSKCQAAVMWTFLAVGYHPNNSKASEKPSSPVRLHGRNCAA